MNDFENVPKCVDGFVDFGTGDVVCGECGGRVG